MVARFGLGLATKHRASLIICSASLLLLICLSWYIHCVIPLRVNASPKDASPDNAPPSRPRVLHRKAPPGFATRLKRRLPPRGKRRRKAPPPREPREAAPKGKHIAIAFHGHYHRYAPKGGCSYYFTHADHIERAIIAPLKTEGNNVSVYFHTYRNLASPALDEQLVTRLGPRSHIFSKVRLPKIVDSYIKVLGLVGNDSDIDYIVLLRFDVRYKRRITELNIHWNKTNFAFRDIICRWPGQKQRYGKVSDLFHVLPISHRLPLIQSLRVSGSVSWDPTGAGHWAAYFLAKQKGVSSLRMISDYCGSSDTTYTGDLLPHEDFESPFLGIDRACSTGQDAAVAERPRRRR